MRAEAAAGLGRVALRRTIEDVVKDLPEIRFQDIEVQIDQQTQKQCDLALRELQKIGVSLEDALELSIQGKDKTHAFFELSKARAALATAKVPSAIKIIEQYEANEEPLVVFSCMRNPIDILDERPGWATITGDVTGPARDQVVESFQAGKLKGVGLTVAAGGVGITLHRASNALFIDYDWVPANNAQAYARIRRIGQKRAQLIVRLVANHELDRQVLRCIDRKINIINNSIKAFEEEQRTKGLVDRFSSGDGKQVDVRIPDRRGPKTALEIWAADSIRKLAEHDPDYALGSNRIGFNRVDSEVGHQLADKLEIGLTEREWLVAIKIAKRYPGQVGVSPE
jgi:SNF2 family DNA or RNA helicase